MTLYRPINKRTGATALPHDSMTGANCWILANGGFDLWRVDLLPTQAVDCGIGTLSEPVLPVTLSDLEASLRNLGHADARAIISNAQRIADQMAAWEEAGEPHAEGEHCPVADEAAEIQEHFPAVWEFACAGHHGGGGSVDLPADPVRVELLGLLREWVAPMHGMEAGRFIPEVSDRLCRSRAVIIREGGAL